MSSDPPQSVIIRLHADGDSKEAVEFFHRLGLCISIWAYVDRRLYQIFHHATGFEQKQSALVYYGNRSFNPRLRMVDKAVKAELSADDFRDLWKPLHAEAHGLSYTRNILAHHPVHRLGTAINGSALDIFSIHIEPYERVLNDDYPGLQGKDQLEIGDLLKHEANIMELESKLHTFAWEMGSRRAATKPRP